MITTTESSKDLPVRIQQWLKNRRNINSKNPQSPGTYFDFMNGGFR